MYICAFVFAFPAFVAGLVGMGYFIDYSIKSKDTVKSSCKVISYNITDLECYCDEEFGPIDCNGTTYTCYKSQWEVKGL